MIGLIISIVLAALVVFLFNRLEAWRKLALETLQLAEEQRDFINEQYGKELG